MNYKPEYNNVFFKKNQYIYDLIQYKYKINKIIELYLI